MYRVILIAIIVILPSIAQCRYEKPDSVYLKGGSVLVGDVTFIPDSCMIEVKLSEDRILDLYCREIDSINGKELDEYEAIRKGNEELLESLKTFVSGFQMGIESYASDGVSGLCLSLGYIFTSEQIVSFGPAFGVDMNSENFALPAFFMMRIAFTRRPAAPYIYTNVGYLIPTGESVFNDSKVQGIYFGGGLGYRSKAKGGPLFGIGFRLMGTKTIGEGTAFLPKISSDITTALSFNVGVTF